MILIDGLENEYAYESAMLIGLDVTDAAFESFDSIKNSIGQKIEKMKDFFLRRWSDIKVTANKIVASTSQKLKKSGNVQSSKMTPEERKRERELRYIAEKAARSKEYIDKYTEIVALNLVRVRGKNLDIDSNVIYKAGTDEILNDIRPGADTPFPLPNELLDYQEFDQFNNNYSENISKAFAMTAIREAIGMIKMSEALMKGPIMQIFAMLNGTIKSKYLQPGAMKTVATVLNAVGKIFKFILTIVTFPLIPLCRTIKNNDLARKLKETKDQINWDY